MRNKENIKELLDYFQTLEDKESEFDEEGIVTAYQKNDDNQSLAIKILSIFGGILASLAFLGFLVITGLYNSNIGMMIFGTLSIATALWINKKYVNIIMDTVSVSTFIIGFILLGIGLGYMQMNENTISIAFIIISLLSLSIVQNYILSFISVLIINGSILALIHLNNNLYSIPIYVPLIALLLAYVFLNEAKIIKFSKPLSKLYNPIRIGLLFSFLSALIIPNFTGIYASSPTYIWLSSAIIIPIIIYLLSHLIEILNITRIQNKIIVYVISTLLLLPTALSPAISGALLVVLLSFLVNYKTGFVIGIIAFIFFISQYYYDLNFTLLTKSILLFLSGVLFLGLYLVTHKKLTTT